MPALPLVLTTAGRDALINAQNTGVSNVVITEIGLSPTQVALTAATAAIPGEFKRLTGVGGQVVAPETFYISGTDTSADTYTVRTVALYLSTGVLLGAYSQAAVLLEKAEPAMAVIEASIRLAEPLATEIEFTGGGWNNPPASEAVEGILRLATQAEVTAGANGTRAVTPLTLKTLLTAVLAGFSPTGHTHDAAAVVSGVFAEARIPDLGLNRITGLVAALAGKAASAHSHVMADITGLVDALAGKAAAAHTHVMGDITGLVAALAGKAAAVHSHVMADVTGLVAALALKAELAGAAFTGQISAPAVIINGLGANYRDLQWRTANVLRWDLFADPDAGGGNAGSNLVLYRYADNGDPLGSVVTFSRASGVAFFASRPAFAGATPWDSANFDPATKATLNSHATFANLTATGVLTGTTGIRTGGVGLGNVNIATGNADYTGYVEFNTPEGVRLGYVGFAHKTTKQINFTAENGGSFGFNTRPNFAGATPWDSLNFDPATKVSTANFTWANLAGKPNVAILGQTAAFNDVYADRGNGTGVLFLGASGSRYLEYDGAAYRLPNAPLFSQGYQVWTSGTLDPTPATAAQFRANSSGQPLNPTGVWAAAALVAAAQAGTIAVDLSGGLNFTTTMTGNRTLGAPSNAKPGQSGVIQIIQDGTGNRTLAFDAAWKFEGGIDPVLSTAAGARDVLVFTVIAAGDVVASLLKDVR